MVENPELERKMMLHSTVGSRARLQGPCRQKGGLYSFSYNESIIRELLFFKEIKTFKTKLFTY